MERGLAREWGNLYVGKGWLEIGVIASIVCR